MQVFVMMLFCPMFRVLAAAGEPPSSAGGARARALALAAPAALDPPRRLDAEIGCDNPAADTCVITCVAQACSGGLQCAAGKTCVVSCVGTDACRDATLGCPDGEYCELTCSGSN